MRYKSIPTPGISWTKTIIALIIKRGISTKEYHERVNVSFSNKNATNVYNNYGILHICIRCCGLYAHKLSSTTEHFYVKLNCAVRTMSSAI